jgi:anti-sigma factor (TIGR02949 family)
MGDHSGSGPDDQRCTELVDALSEFLDGEMDSDERRSFERHLEGCEGCRVALDQFQTVIRLTGRLTPADVASLDALIRDRLIAISGVARRR